MNRNFIPTRKVISNNKILIGFKLAEINKHKKLHELMDENSYYTHKGLTYFDKNDLTEAFLNKLVKSNGFI
jgi:hypothetical protein